MKTLSESLFDKDLEVKKTLPELLDELDLKKYSTQQVDHTVDEIIKYCNATRYFLQKDKNVIRNFGGYIDAHHHRPYVIITRSGDDKHFVYSIGWTRDDRWHSYSYFDYCRPDKKSKKKWISGAMEFDWNITFDTGAGQLIFSLRNQGWDDAYLIDDEQYVGLIIDKMYDLKK